jgi:hypothetical protein
MVNNGPLTKFFTISVDIGFSLGVDFPLPVGKAEINAVGDRGHDSGTTF